MKNDWLKQLLVRALFGVMMGIATCHLIALGISLSIQDGDFYATTSDLVTHYGTPLQAVVIQNIWAAFYGAAWGASSVIWQKEQWSLLRRTVSHLVVMSLVTLPVAYYLYWMPRSIVGVISYFAMFFAVYAVIWIVTALMTYRRICSMNRHLGK